MARTRRQPVNLGTEAFEALRDSSIRYVLERARSRYPDVTDDSPQTPKKNYSEVFSRALAQLLADLLRPTFPGIQPDARGLGHESPTTGARGSKKTDVRYSTPDIGLGFVISIKTTHFRDRKNRQGRISFGDFNHNEIRFDAEFRAEAAEIHERNPFAVLIGVFILPEESTLIFSRGNNPSSFAKWARRLRFRASREKPDDRNELFEKIFIGLYKRQERERGKINFFDVMGPPPIRGLPIEGLITLEELITQIKAEFDRRNNTSFKFGPSTLEDGEGLAISPDAIVEPEDEPC
jgi:hypothetical protein